MIAAGLAAGALAALMNSTIEAQLIIAALVGSIATLALRRSRIGGDHQIDARRDPNVNLDIGQSVQVDEWSSYTAGIYKARVMYRGAQWDVEYASQDAPPAGAYKIVEIRGSQFIVERT
jgi:membrane protein implicated in regulation of membrane protease activity